MARYADYVKDDLDNEIEEASENTETRQESNDDGFQMPDRFKGKSPEEIARSFVELEKLNSRQAQDLGTMRKSVDELIALQLQESKEPPVEESTVDIDALYEDTEGAISKVADKTVGRRIDALESQLQKSAAEEKFNKFVGKHSDWEQTAHDPKFLEWVNESPYRTRLAKAADAFDFDAANDLFDMYKDHTSSVDEEKAAADAQKRQKQLRDATLETSSPGVIDTDETFSRTNLTRARIAAKKGDASARAYLSTNADAIALAYEEGRITD